MSDLRSDLQSVDGVGEKTAEKLISVLEEGGYLDSDDGPLMAKARAAAHEGNDRDAAMYLRRAGAK
jgi:Holliday junction resolvasome RuvABC DNA-binding subunit